MTQSVGYYPNYDDWELRWAPYDPPTYQAVLDQLHPGDTVLEIGAGDLRLARQMAGFTCKVYGIEINNRVLDQGLQYPQPLPDNLIVINADALVTAFPLDVTTGVLLMRHCTHFELYANKLRNLGCQKLITNARWRMAVESIDLQALQTKFEDVKIGWYACWCGAVGFKNGPVELLTPETNEITHEVIDCPECSHR
jgi:SAM-dependent methyltransferase